jgi:hypothetical protein
MAGCDVILVNCALPTADENHLDNSWQARDWWARKKPATQLGGRLSISS